MFIQLKTRICQCIKKLFRNQNSGGDDMTSNNPKRATISKVNGIYRVKKLDLHVGDRVIWSSDETDFKIWFPPGRDPLSIRESRRVPKGENFRRTVPGSAVELFENNEFELNMDSNEETYQYSIFCYENNSFAEGNSMAEIIIRR
jgi:hypothetical protein